MDLHEPREPVRAPGIARGRRTFFAPVWLLLVAAALFAALLFTLWRGQMTTSIIVVRHAEKQLGTIADPPLAPEGQRRAHALADLFATGRSVGAIQAIYVSNTRRARETAAPLALRLGLTPRDRDPRGVRALAREILREHAGQVVLVVGHSNTVPPLISELTEGRFQISMSEDDYGQLYIVSRPSVGPAGLVQMRF
ncbi:MAG: histidine phosphatase family protein [Steroidobacteraceae bacterium]|nr:histidine phosphatase family protein [Steroidobacteraceae bacterium]